MKIPLSDWAARHYNPPPSLWLGHAGERVADKYADPCGIEPVRVKVG